MNHEFNQNTGRRTMSCYARYPYQYSGGKDRQNNSVKRVGAMRGLITGPECVAVGLVTIVRNIMEANG